MGLVAVKGKGMETIFFFAVLLGLAAVFGGEAALAKDLFTIAGFDSFQIFREGEAPSGGADRIQLSAALGETEGFQIVVVNRSRETLRDISVSVSGLRGVEAMVYAAGSVKIDKPGRTTKVRPGRYFDLLRPAGWETIAPGNYRPYWVDLRVPAQGVKPGIRTGKMVVRAGGKTKTIKVRLRVFGFRLPATPTLKLAFAFVPAWMKEYYGYSLAPEQIRAAQDVMLDHRLGPTNMWSRGTELFQKETLKHCLERGLNVVFLKCGRTGESLAALQPQIEMLKELGALDKAHLFGFDEILMQAHASSRLPMMRKVYEAFHAKYPGIKRINTSWPDDRLRDFVDIFVVPTMYFIPGMAEDEEVWWYSVGADKLKLEPDFRIDFPAAIQRGFFLADWKVGVKGHLYWAVTREWPANKGIQDKSRPENEWVPGYINSITKKWTQGNGGGNLFYPDGSGSMLPSTRAKRLRDGVEDYEYLAQLKAAARELKRAKPRGWKRLVQAAEKLLAIPENVVKLWEWNFSGDDGMCNLTNHPKAVHDSGQALRMIPGGGHAAVYQDVNASAGEAYTVSGWIKTDDLTGSACIKAEFRDKTGAVLLAKESGHTSGSTQYHQVSLVMPVSPAATARLRINLVTAPRVPSPPGRSTPMPKAFFDDIAISRADGVALVLADPGFESGRLWISRDPAPLVSYRERVGECLQRSARALRSKGPFTGK